jgi:hypothetical protein
LPAAIAAFILTALGSSAAWNAASWASEYANVAGSSLRLGVLIFWLLPSLSASLSLLAISIHRNNLKEEGHL